MLKSFVFAVFSFGAISTANAAGAGTDLKDKADEAMTNFQFCTAEKIATLGKAESSEFLVTAALEACRQEADNATEAFFAFAKQSMHATAQQHEAIAELYAKEMHTRVVQLVVAFKSQH
ncbi:hypothetical protein [Lichenifustis flavocetrariae]|uniref:Uncharacterized protein n=1 Tax=Lichenifustis flavocetrariae TaxID=2949735 RepID=A0AA42CKW2_9HYPH|nr:hypothetical protein [Lichenifustis flavocetrariae]MCW6509706.1 hypothetical protein [Lichenifustis flavocetrariae]